MADYEKQVTGYMKWLSSKNIERRRKAAMMLGELGADEAIPRLVKHYKKDPDPIVRKNAEYSLGMFRAFQEAMSGSEEDQERAIAALTPVAETGTIGKRAKIPPSFFIRLLIGLSVLLLVLIIANVSVFFLTGKAEALFGGSGERTAQTSDNDTQAVAQNQTIDGDPLAQAAAASTQLDALRTNAEQLQTQYDPTLNGAPPADCTGFYDLSLTPLAITDADRAAFPELAQAIDMLNSGLEDLNSAKTRIDQACFDEMPLSVDEANTQYTTILTFIENTATISTLLDTVRTQYDPNAPEPTAVPPTAAPTATFEVQIQAIQPPNPRQYVGDLFNIIDDVNGARGARPQLVQFWEDAQNNAGETDGCRTSRPRIPGNYALPPNIAEIFPDLTTATAEVNQGLTLIRQSWDQFENACAGGPSVVQGQATSGLTLLSGADGAFRNAAASLQQISTAGFGSITAEELQATEMAAESGG